MDKLGANDVKTMDYHDNVILPLETCVTRMTDREQQRMSGSHMDLVM